MVGEKEVGGGTRGISPWAVFPASPDDWYSAEEMAKADEYVKPLRRVMRVGSALGFIASVGVVLLHLAPRAIDALGVSNWVVGLFVAILVMQVVSTVVGLPFGVWRELKYDKKWGFSTQTTKGFVVDELKSLPIVAVLYTLLFGPLWAVIRTTDLWWLWGGLVFAVVSVVIGVLFPIVIFPLFNKYTPLEEGELRAAILDAARQANADITQVLVEDSSKRDTRPNAYVAGLGKVRRVVVFDNMLEYPNEAIVSVIAHEIGHWKMRHILRTIPLSIVMNLVTFAILGLVLDNTRVLSWAGVDSLGDPGALPLFLLAFTVVGKLTGLASAWLSRAHERQADLFAYNLLGSPAELRDFFHKVSVSNLADLRPNRWHRVNASHPPFAERMAMAQAWDGAESTTR
jgi:STE24 endopeptidase